MSKRQKIAILRRASQRSRSRSITPGPWGDSLPGPSSRPVSSRRKLLMSRASAVGLEPEVNTEEPQIWSGPPPPNRALRLRRTPGGSLRPDGEVELCKSPGGSLRQKPENIFLSSQERAAEADLEMEEVVDSYDHVRKWVGELPSLESFVPVPRSCRMPEPAEECDESGAPSAQADHPGPSVQDAQPGTSGHHGSSHSVIDSQEAVPSTSACTASFRQRPAEVRDGSEFDSDFDDHFEVERIPVEQGAVVVRDISADNELTEDDEGVLNLVDHAMDNALEELIGTSGSFDWQEDFDTFRGTREVFSGPTPGPIKDYDTPYDAFVDIWDRDIMELIVRETNRFAQQEIEELTAAGTLRTSRLSRWSDTDVDEMYVFLAVMILMGLDPRTSQNEYWETSGFLEMPKFRQLLSYNRFILLNKCLHFVNNLDLQCPDNSQGAAMSPKLKKLAPVLVHLNSKFQSLYNLEQDVAIDESLTLFKGRLSWIQAIRSKAARFGIKSYELCESRTGYLAKFEIYTGKRSESGDYVALSENLAGKSTQVVLRLLKGLGARGHLVTMDNFYNSPALARYLKSKGFDCMGTLRANRKNVPKDIAKVPKNVAKGTIVARHCGDVSCLAWKDTKVVTMISTYHTDDTYVGTKAGKVLVKPIVVRDYNKTMGGVDLKDQKLSMYLLERKRCVKWYKKMFKRLLNISVHNSLVMMLGSLARRGMDPILHREFRKKLANSLVEKHLKSPQAIQVVSSGVMRLRRDILHVPIGLDRKHRTVCHVCWRNDIRKSTTLKCQTCDTGLCLGDCWVLFHSAQQLPGRDVQNRKRRRLE